MTDNNLVTAPPFSITLLVHEREYNKRRNSGRVVRKFLPDMVQTIVWNRTEQGLFDRLPATSAVLWPCEQAETISVAARFTNYIVIDASWQGARKIMAQSRYLQALPKVSFNPDTLPPSKGIRRNQIEGGVSTCETVVQLLAELDQPKKASLLARQFELFTSAIKAGLPYDGR